MVCEICGKEMSKSSFGRPYDRICSSECFSKKFWLEIIEKKDKHVFADHESFVIGPEESSSPFRGCAGRAFYIKYLDSGKIVKTTNLWCQGKIPEEFWSQLSDTVEFVTREEYEKSLGEVDQYDKCKEC